MHGSSTIESAERPTCADGLSTVPSFALPPPSIPRQLPPCRLQERHSAPPGDGHPAGLHVLCAVEACAGFALNALGSLLVLYLTEAGQQGQATALRWVGTFNAACFVAPLAGGFLADRWLGLHRAVLGGAALFAAGFVALACLPAMPWPGLALLLLGSGLFRSNVVAMLGRLYPAGDARRDSGFRLLYAAFNLGALLAPPLAGVLAEARRWHLAFLLGAGAMLVALLVLQRGRYRLECADRLVDKGQDSFDTSDHCPASEFGRWLALAVVVQVMLLWSLAYGQTDGTLLLWARDHTRRSFGGFEVPASIFIAVPPLLVLILTPLWALADRCAVSSSTIGKILAGLVCTSLAFLLMAGAASGTERPASAAWLLGSLVLLTVGELLVGTLTQSLVGRLTPQRRAGFTCALWYAATALGLWLAGQVGALWPDCPPENFFALLALVPLSAGLLLLAQRGYLSAALARGSRIDDRHSTA